jgi:hypothetical protein
MKGLLKMINKLFLPFLFLAALISASGCATYSQQSRAMTEAWQSGNGLLAAGNATQKAEEAVGSKDELIWRLEQGTILSAIGDLEGSLNAFNAAEEIVDRYEAEAKIKVASETMAAFQNQAKLPYRGRPYDKIMMNTYKALNYMLLSRPDAVRVELNRVLQRQQDAVAENAKRLEKAVEDAGNSKQGAVNEDGTRDPAYDVSQAQNDPRFSAAIEAEMAEVDARILPYADYVNPFSVFLEGVFFSHLGTGNADIERARKSFERVKSMSPGTYIAADYKMAEELANGAQGDSITYIVFATGSAPSRDETRIDIPLFAFSDVSYVGASFPKLVYHDNYIEQISVFSGGQDFYSELLCSMDAVISRDFKNDWPEVMTKTLITTATKAVAGQAAEKALDDNVMGRWAAKAANIAYQSATNIADQRTWTTLPKKYAYIRVPTPPDGKMILTVGSRQKSVEIIPGKTNMVLVRSVNPDSPSIIESFTLN